VLTSASGDWTGGKSRRRVQPFGDPLLHGRLIVLDVQEVIGLFVRQDFRDLRRAEDRIAGDDLALERDDPPPSQRRLVLVGLRLDADRADDGLDLRGEQRQ
jgi:hypothetical protein